MSFVRKPFAYLVLAASFWAACSNDFDALFTGATGGKSGSSGTAGTSGGNGGATGGSGASSGAGGVAGTSGSGGSGGSGASGASGGSGGIGGDASTVDIIVKAGTAQIANNDTQVSAPFSLVPSKSVLFYGKHHKLTTTETYQVRAELTSTGATFVRAKSAAADAGTPLDISYFALQHPAINVQRGTTTMAPDGAPSVVLPLSPVATNASFCTVSNKIFGTPLNGEDLISCEITPTTLTLQSTNGVADADVAWQVVEFTDGTTVSPGTTTLPANSNSQTAPIGASVPLDRSFLYLNYRTNVLNFTGTPDTIGLRGDITASDTLTFSRESVSASPDLIIKWFVIVLPTANSVTKYDLSLAATKTSVAFTGAFDPTRTIAITSTWGRSGSGNATISGLRDIDFTLTLSTSELTVTRGNASGTAHASVYAVKF